MWQEYQEVEATTGSVCPVLAEPLGPQRKVGVVVCVEDPSAGEVGSRKFCGQSF